MDSKMKRSCCQACLLSERMKDCKNCSFNIGLSFKAKIKAKPVKIETKEETKESHIQLSLA